MDEKNIVSENSGANIRNGSVRPQSDEQKTQEKPKLVKLPVEEALFEFDGFEFEEVKRPERVEAIKVSEGLTDLTEEIVKKQPASDLETSLKKDADLIAKLSEVHGIPAKNKSSENTEEKAESEDPIRVEVVVPKAEEKSSEEDETEAESADNEADSDDENEASIAPEIEKTVKKGPILDESDGEYEAAQMHSEDDEYSAYSQTVEKSDAAEENVPAQPEEAEDPENDESFAPALVGEPKLEAPAEEVSEVAESEAVAEDTEEEKTSEEPAKEAIDSSLPSASKEEKTHMAAQIAASFTGSKNDESDSGQVTFLDIINGEDEAEKAEENAPEPEKTEEAAEEAEASEENAEGLTPLEIAANEEPEEHQEEEVKDPEPQREDIWDDEDREMMRAKKRYLDYCRSLTIPPLRVIKETVYDKEKAKISSSKPKGSGYRYEKVERLPLFPDGIHGGKDTEGYREREIAYCAEREEKKGAELRNKARSCYSRTIFAAVLMITVLLFENLNVFLGNAPDKLLTSENVYLFAGIEIALLVFGAILIFDSICDGIASLLKGSFIPETMTVGLVLASIAYHVSLMAYAPLPESAVLLGSPVALAILLTSLYKYNMINREITAFGVASSYGEYTTEVKMQSFENSPEGRSFKGMASAKTTLYKTNKVSRIDGCYTARPVRDECFGMLRKLAIGVLCVSVLVGVIFGLLKADVCYGILSAYVIIILASPTGVFISMFYPRIRGAKTAADAGAAFIGFDDESDEFDESVIMVNDGDIFHAENLKVVEFVACQTPDMEMQLSRICGLCSKMGGPVEKIFKNIGLAPCGEVTFAEIEDRGVAAWIDGKFVVAGSENYLAKYGAEAERYDGPMSPNGRAMYIAENGEFIARIIMEFTADEEICEKISEHRHTETLFALKTCNPCIDMELLFDTTGIEPDFLRLVKYNAGDDVMPAENDREGVLVSKTGLNGLLTAMLEYKRQKRLIFAGSKFAGVSCVIGGCVGLMLAFIGTTIGFMSVTTALVSCAMALLSAFTASRSAINTKSKKKKD